MGKTFTTHRLIRHGHTDPAGFAFFPRYYELINETVEDFFREALGRPFGEMHLRHRTGIPTVHIDTTFHSPSYCDDELDFALVVARLGRSSATFEITATCHGQKRLTTRNTVAHVLLDRMKSVPFDSGLREGLAGYLVDEEETELS